MITLFILLIALVVLAKGLEIIISLPGYIRVSLKNARTMKQAYNQKSFILYFVSELWDCYNE